MSPTSVNPSVNNEATNAAREGILAGEPKQGRIRKIIETLFSQLCDQLMIKRNYAKTMEGPFARIIAKIASVTILKTVNKIKGTPPPAFLHPTKKPTHNQTVSNCNVFVRYHFLILF